MKAKLLTLVLISLAALHTTGSAQQSAASQSVVQVTVAPKSATAETKAVAAKAESKAALATGVTAMTVTRAA